MLQLIEIKIHFKCITWKETCFFAKPWPIWSTLWRTKLNNHRQKWDNQRQTVRKPNKHLVSLGIGGIASIIESNWDFGLNCVLNKIYKLHWKYPKEYYLSCIHVSMAMVLMNVKEQTKRYCKMKPKNKIDMLKAAIA